MRAETGPLEDLLDDTKLVGAVHRSIRSKTKSYRYVLPTQLLAKLADPSLNCRSLQAGKGGAGAFDARSLAHEVVVPFDAANHNVLGGSPEPYVNNPLRVPEVSARYAKAQKNKPGWRDLCSVVDAVEKTNQPQFTKRLFDQVLIEVHRQLAEVRIAYPVPLRVSLAKTLGLVDRFLADRSGGDRVQAVACALFELVGLRFGLYKEVRRGVINAADAATGLMADLECVTEGERIVFAVEVKDQQLTIAHVESKLRTAREKQVKEILFVAQHGIAPSDEPNLPDRVEEEFAKGQNIYVLELASFGKAVFPLMGEEARPEFLRLIGSQLDRYRSDLRHRQAWRDLLARG